MQACIGLQLSTTVNRLYDGFPNERNEGWNGGFCDSVTAINGHFVRVSFSSSSKRTELVQATTGLLVDSRHLRGFHYICFRDCNYIARIWGRFLCVDMLNCSIALFELLHDNKSAYILPARRIWIGLLTFVQVFIYYFLVERVYIIRRKSNSRLKDKLYLFNSFGMLVPYLVVIALNFYFRFADYEKDSCRIGMKRVAMIPLIAFDILVNVYLTSLFLIPLRSLYSYRTSRSSQTRTVALRTFIGSCCTLTSSVVNLTVVMVLKGEPGWICLMCCNIDILFSVLVLHWITSKDNASTLSQSPNFRPTSDPTSPVRLVPRPPISDMEAYHMGLRDLSRKSGVTTMVTAKDYDDLELERINSMPPNVVTIETEYTMEVSAVRPDTEGSGSDLGMQRVRIIGSKEELFGKENC
ncbi:hypothetical protein IFR05_005663 [Cadophora sp. M221]|nr:hypothetical protein IFR05_005663 [Cadophora sp. M221]